MRTTPTPVGGPGPRRPRHLVPLVLALLAARVAASDGQDAAAPGSAGEGFDVAAVHERARRLASEAPRVLEGALPEGLTALDYDAYRQIAFRPERRFWRGEPRGFSLDVMHLGSIFRIPVAVHVVEDGVARPIAYDPELFEFRGAFAPPTEALPGVSGFRLWYPLDRPDESQEFLVFQGASYFRGVGRDQRYGTSARGLALGTADPRGEEFPAFTSFWVERPAQTATEVRFHGLLESESVTGVYTFVARPGDATVVDVEATLYARHDVDAVGIAPLTSMFLFDTINRHEFDDFRDAVHDAGGLQIVTGTGQRVWRPLTNPSTVQVSAFMDEAPQGFGLTQRRRAFGHYGDVEARYERRPSVWVEPVGDWGKGAVVLVEIPVQTEFNDNIVAFWRPDQPLRAGASASWSYRLSFCEQPPDTAPLARVAATRTGVAPNNGRRLFVVDFDPPDTQDDVALALEASTSAGVLVGHRIERLPESGRRRVTLEFDPGDAVVAELRLLLTEDGEPRSETWLHRWTP